MFGTLLHLFGNVTGFETQITSDSESLYSEFFPLSSDIVCLTFVCFLTLLVVLLDIKSSPDKNIKGKSTFLWSNVTVPLQDYFCTLYTGMYIFGISSTT